MFLHQMIRRKDGKEHHYFSVVENKRVAGGRVVQRHVLYLGEINATQERAWRKSIEVFDEGAAEPRTLSLFPEDRCEGLLPGATVIGAEAVADAAAATAAVGCVLADAGVVAGAPARPLLGAAAAASALRSLPPLSFPTGS
jgi:hypothetical protein